MPTLQSSPLYKWTFPDQAVKKNKKGVGWAGVGQTTPQPVPEAGPEPFYAAHERKVAMDRLQNNHNKMLGMLGVKDTTARSQRYTNKASQSQSHINGKFTDPAYEFTSTAGGLRGGTQVFFYSQAGQDWLENWRKQRITELNAIQKGDFSAGRPARIPVFPQYDGVDAVLAKVLDQFEAGAFSNGLLDDMNKLQGAFLNMGTTITSQKLAQYMRVVGDIRRQVQRITADPEPTVNRLDAGDEADEVAENARRGLPAPQYRAGTYKLDAKDIKLIRATGLVADRLVRLLEELNGVVNESPEVRKSAVEEIGSRVLGSIAKQQSAYGQRSTQPRTSGNVEARPTEQRNTMGLLSERESRLPEQRPPAELQTLAGQPPVKPF